MFLFKRPLKVPINFLVWFSDNEDLFSTYMGWTLFFWTVAPLFAIISHLCLNSGNVQITLKKNIFWFLLPVLLHLSSPWSKSQDKLHSICETKLLVDQTRTGIHQIDQGLFSHEDEACQFSALLMFFSAYVWVAGHHKYQGAY